MPKMSFSILLPSMVFKPYLFRLRVESFSLDRGVVDAVFLSSGDADLHLEPDLHGGHPLEVLDAGRDVLLVKLLGQVQHVAGEEGLVVLLKRFKFY